MFERIALLGLPTRIVLLDALGLAHLLLPERFERPGDEAVFRFDRVILPTGALSLIPGAFPLQRPLPVEKPVFAIHLIMGGDGERDTVGRKGFEEQTLHGGIDMAGTHRLTCAQRLAVLAVIDTIAAGAV